MQIISIHLRNIKSHHDTELCFAPGINVLAGPNGAGKSTIFEAIGYALFGVDAKDFVSNAERFLTIGARRGEISVVFQADDGCIWRVSRTVGAAAKWLLAREVGGCFEVEEHARMEETGARLAEILGLDNGRSLADQFKLVIGPFQNDFLGPFVIRQPTRRQEAFDEILGIDAWRTTYKGTAGLLSAVQERIRLLSAELAGKLEQLEVLPDRLAEQAGVAAESARCRQGLQDKQAALAVLDGRLEALEAREKQIAVLNGEIQILESRIKDGTVKIGEQQQLVERSRCARQLVNETRAGKELFEKLEETLQELRIQEQRRRAVEQELAGLETEAVRSAQLLSHERSEVEKTARQLHEDLAAINDSRRELQPDEGRAGRAAQAPDLRRQLEVLRGQRSLLDGRRESLLEGREKLAEGNCPFFQEPCRNIAGSPPRDVFSNRIAELERQACGLDTQILQLGVLLGEAEAAEQELNNRAVRLRELDKQVAVLEERRSHNRVREEGLAAIASRQVETAAAVETGKAALTAFGDLDRQIEHAERQRQQHKPAHDAYTANLNLSHELEARLLQLDKMQRLLGELSTQLAVRQADVNMLGEGFQPELLLQLRREREGVLAEIAAERQQSLNLERAAERLAEEIARLGGVRAEAEARQAEIKEFEEKEKLVRFLRNQVFKHVSAQLSERFREEISLRADRIYRTIAEADEELYWGDNYQIVLKDFHGGAPRERSDDQLSGGQMMSAVVALRLALLQTIGARVAFFDEPTSNLDAARRENLAHAFRAIDVGREEVSEHWYDQLFLVSHDIAFSEITDKVVELG